MAVKTCSFLLRWAFAREARQRSQTDSIPAYSLIAETLIVLQNRAKIQRNTDYELTSINDGIRGATNPYRTAARKIKGQYASVRLGALQNRSGSVHEREVNAL